MIAAVSAACFLLVVELLVVVFSPSANIGHVWIATAILAVAIFGFAGPFVKFTGVGEDLFEDYVRWPIFTHYLTIAAAIVLLAVVFISTYVKRQQEVR